MFKLFKKKSENEVKAGTVLEEPFCYSLREPTPKPKAIQPCKECKCLCYEDDMQKIHPKVLSQQHEYETLFYCQQHKKPYDYYCSTYYSPETKYYKMIEVNPDGTYKGNTYKT